MLKLMIPMFILIVMASGLKILNQSKSFIGFLGERGVRSRLDKLDKSRYCVINDLLIPHYRGNGTSQIDHVVVFSGGVAVIETKNWAGRVYGKGHERNWTVTLGRNKYRHENPILQNKGHIRSIQAIVGDVPIHNIVVFSSRTDLRLSEISDAMVTQISKIDRVIRNIDKRVLNDQDIQEIHQRLLGANTENREMRAQHVKNVKKRFERE
ncbi:nuclease-like protein [Alicyclobacillus sacchari]|uniref:Nuclease-like protein n=1 Tax=Alicyclobacillus sacchari TaxID=392010 RepID=A0A4V3HCR9_9BACL|nr:MULTISPECIES: nuclease-related domain-containing protein [Alicyclobacillus]EJY57205.1 citrate synthase 3 [Alicyclobacillus hesperidum URH17-3-68]TDY38254.1 nuclease-like protein [Alicyclobacillus sacchari]GMA59365.1 hypothetical protein GCM10025858_38680 [Alicyclobacillus sacchari]